MSDAHQTDHAAQAAPYQVLARRRRPQTFDALIGQEAMVRTLRNAFAAERIAHAFVLTGVRGVGKTTTARILAKGLNCIGPDGAGGPTIDPCGVCDPCRAIAESRFVDVLEIDAASHTGVDFVRDLNEMARTTPSARFRVFILDEVHMLSTSAFNALLKTLEEPPPRVKFVFATTDIHKVPATILSRCQRFDLRRVEPERMIAFLAGIASGEGATVAEDALALLARAAEGSVRDALSLLDQAIAHAAGAVSAEQIRAMLGLADRGRVLDLFERVMAGDPAGALAEFGAQYAEGADPAAVLRDLAEITHWLSVVKIAPDAAMDPTLPPGTRARGRALAERLGMRSLARAWQMLLKALDEVARAPSPAMAAEMALIRLTHVAELPTPEDLVRRLTEGGAPPPSGGRPAPSGGGGGATALATAAPAAAPSPGPLAAFETFDAVVALIRDKRDMKLLYAVETFLRLVRYAPGRIEFAPAENAPADLAGDLTRRLGDWTGARWVVTVSAEQGAPTIAERRRATERDLRARAAEAPLVAAALRLFPGAEIKAVRPLSAEPAAAAPEGLAPAPEDDDDEAFGDDWTPVDPFDEE
ncbi:MAG: DNA polymerase III subunit gamma/tau [Rhodobacteraceae bacterium]|nr:MAG: DNA polymerase III subunit gamma/tau [Paracoccaceae bacterium]